MKISEIVTNYSKTLHKKSIKLHRKHALRFCKAKSETCNFIKKGPKLKKID